jgi:hypothetical protein
MFMFHVSCSKYNVLRANGQRLMAFQEGERRSERVREEVRKKVGGRVLTRRGTHAEECEMFKVSCFMFECEGVSLRLRLPTSRRYDDRRMAKG